MSAVETPVRLEAHEPPEVRGRGRDDVALLVASRHDGRLVHAAFRDLPRFLDPGDLLVVNTSGTLPAALPAGDLELRLSTRTAPGRWLVELRTADGERFRGAREGDRIPLPEGRAATLLARHAGRRLWLAQVELDDAYLRRHGRPIRYGYVPHEWPIEDYQTVFALEPGSAEMPSAGRPFTTELITDFDELVAHKQDLDPLQRRLAAAVQRIAAEALVTGTVRRGTVASSRTEPRDASNHDVVELLWPGLRKRLAGSSEEEHR